MYTVEDLKQDLPAWPDEILEHWLLEFANDDDYGWSPFRGTAKPAWNGLFPDGFNIQDAASLSWSRTLISPGLPGLEHKEYTNIRRMAQLYIRGEVNEYSILYNGVRRFDNLRAYISEHGTIPRPLIAIRTKNGLSIIDGNHRACILYWGAGLPSKLKKNLGFENLHASHEMWIGEQALPPQAAAIA